MSTTYAPHEDAEIIATTQISAYHPHLADRRLAYVERIADAMAPEPVTAKLLSGLHRYLAHCDAVLVVDSRSWALLEDAGKQAAVDHALASLRDDGDGLYLRKPEAAEFAEVIVRRGLWRRDLQVMGSVMAEQVRQRSLFEDGGRTVDPETGEVQDIPITISTPDGQEVHTTTGELRKAADAARSGRLRAVR